MFVARDLECIAVTVYRELCILREILRAEAEELPCVRIYRDSTTPDSSNLLVQKSFRNEMLERAQNVSV